MNTEENETVLISPEDWLIHQWNLTFIKYKSEDMQRNLIRLMGMLVGAAAVGCFLLKPYLFTFTGISILGVYIWSLILRRKLMTIYLLKRKLLYAIKHTHPIQISKETFKQIQSLTNTNK